LAFGALLTIGLPLRGAVLESPQFEFSLSIQVPLPPGVVRPP
jgi:hypothetical protein